LLQLQADWLSEARARILRLAEIATRKRVLDLGAGYGIITSELRRRTSGIVIALDPIMEAIRNIERPVVAGDASRLPFLSGSFDLIFSQNVLMWIRESQKAVAEVFRILDTKGVWVSFEPDYGGMIEFPDETRNIWLDALVRSGADPLIGRRLPSLLEVAGFRLRIELLPRLMPASAERFDFLQELPLTDEERAEMDRLKALSDAHSISHLPYFLIIAEK
jgi:SAM-dependent methyltransferase